MTRSLAGGRRDDGVATELSRLEYSERTGEDGGGRKRRAGVSKAWSALVESSDGVKRAPESEEPWMRVWAEEKQLRGEWVVGDAGGRLAAVAHGASEVATSDSDESGGTLRGCARLVEV